MKYTYPATFPDYDTYVSFLEEARKVHQATQTKVQPQQWLEIFPEAKARVEELLLESLEIRDWYIKAIEATEATFSTDLHTRMFEEAYLDHTLGKALKLRQTQIKEYEVMLSIFKPKPIVADRITEADIQQARNVPMESLLNEEPKRGFIKCMFHGEDVASCKVYSDHIHCFGCGKHLDTIGFIMETQNLDFFNSVKYLCHK